MSVKKCSHCGKDLPEELQFCPYCMERISEPVAVELPKDKKKLNEKSIIIVVLSLILVLFLLVGTSIFIHYKNTENDNNGTTEDINTTDTSGVEDTTENNVLNSNSSKPTQENPTDNKTSNTNKESTSTASDTTTTTNSAVTECKHNWVAITKTVHHDEVGHYETVEKQRKVTKYKCPICYEKFTSLDEYYSHFDSTHKPSYDGDPIKAFRNQYTTESGYEYYEEQKWVVDQKAYDETVIMGYKCSICEEEKE